MNLFHRKPKPMLPMILPDLGDPEKRYTVELTEPEINTLYAAIAFINGCRIPTPKGEWAEQFIRWHDHYGPTLGVIDTKLDQFDGK